MITQIKSTVLYTKEPDPETDRRRQKIVKRRIVENILTIAANQVLKEYLKFEITDKDMSSTLSLLQTEDVTYITEVLKSMLVERTYVLKPSERDKLIEIFNIKQENNENI
jgi:hypothetical protein